MLTKHYQIYGGRDSKFIFMLANNPDSPARFGSLGKEVQKPATFRYELLGFIASELPNWRDRTDRPNETSETVLTTQLCSHLNSAARHSVGWDILQFKVEAPDEQRKGRKIDLVPSPCGPVILIEGRRYIDFDSLLPIECKRLPTPNDKERDEREYVISRYSSTGGIQRFKEGNHGAVHTLGAMIGYVQEETAAFWDKRITEWIQELIDTAHAGWTAKDLLVAERIDVTLGLAVFHSAHQRANGLSEIELRHLWVCMN
jgi:hypothetical protein